MTWHRIVFLFSPVKMVNNCHDEGRKTSQKALWSQISLRTACSRRYGGGGGGGGREGKKEKKEVGKKKERGLEREGRERLL